MIDKPIVTIWTFQSESNARKTHQTIQYSDGSTSCDCKGWTMKRKNSARTCKHTRDAESGMADRHALTVKRYGPAPAQQPARIQPTLKKPAQPVQPLRRLIDLTED